RPYDLLADLVAETLVIDARVVLRRDDDGVHALGNALLVLDRHLGLSVGPQVRQGPVPARFRQLPSDGMCKRDRERHELDGFAHGEPEHHSLIASAELHGIRAVAGLDRLVDTLRDLRRLLFDRGEYAAGPVVETVIGIRVADVLHDAAHEARNVDVRVRRDLARDEDDARGCRGLARHARVGILAETLVEHRVRNLVAELVRVSLRDRLAREEDAIRRLERLRHHVPAFHDRAYSAWAADIVSMFMPIAASLRR